MPNWWRTKASWTPLKTSSLTPTPWYGSFRVASQPGFCCHSWLPAPAVSYAEKETLSLFSLFVFWITRCSTCKGVSTIMTIFKPWWLSLAIWPKQKVNVWKHLVQKSYPRNVQLILTWAATATLLIVYTVWTRIVHLYWAFSLCQNLSLHCSHCMAQLKISRAQLNGVERDFETGSPFVVCVA